MSTPAPWFRPKRFGYGAGLPMAWQGWALLAGWGVVLVICWRLLPFWPALVASNLATLAMALVARRHTQGGWRWRW